MDDTFRKELLAEVAKQQTVKNEILLELFGKKVEKARPFIEHPLFLLVLGFFFTGVLGAALSTFLQDRSWENQQSVLSQQEELKVRTALIDETAAAAAATFTSVED